MVTARRKTVHRFLDHNTRGAVPTARDRTWRRTASLFLGLRNRETELKWAQWLRKQQSAHCRLVPAGSPWARPARRWAGCGASWRLCAPAASPPPRQGGHPQSPGEQQQNNNNKQKQQRKTGGKMSQGRQPHGLNRTNSKSTHSESFVMKPWVVNRKLIRVIMVPWFARDYRLPWKPCDPTRGIGQTGYQWRADATPTLTERGEGWKSVGAKQQTTLDDRAQARQASAPASPRDYTNYGMTAGRLVARLTLPKWHFVTLSTSERSLSHLSIHTACRVPWATAAPSDVHCSRRFSAVATRGRITSHLPLPTSAAPPSGRRFAITHHGGDTQHHTDSNVPPARSQELRNAGLNGRTVATSHLSHTTPFV